NWSTQSLGPQDRPQHDQTARAGYRGSNQRYSLAAKSARLIRALDVEAMRNRVPAFPVRLEAHRRVVGQRRRIVGADARVDVPQSGVFRRCQRDGEEAAPDSTSTSVRADMRPDDPPPLGNVVRVPGSCPIERLETNHPAITLRNGTRDPVLHVEVTFANQCGVDRARS